MRGYLGLGSNLGDRCGHLELALERLVRAGVRTRALSAVWETAAVDCEPPLPFLNMVAEIETDHAPLELLEVAQRIEREAGRQVRDRHAPRTLDIDLLLLDDLVLDDPRLTLPHPRMWSRSFVLAPLGEIAPDLRNPRTGRSVAQAWAELEHPSAVRRIGPLARARATPL